MIKRLLCLILVVAFCVVQCSASAPSSDIGGYVSPDIDTFVSASGGVDGRIGLTAYLGAHGIYLSANADMQSFSDFTLGLDSYWDDFARAAGEGISNLADMSVSLVRGGLALTKKQWDLYARFGRWLIDKFKLQDNQSDVELKEDSVVSDSPYLSNSALAIGDGYYSGSSRNYSFTDGNISISAEGSIYAFYGNHYRNTYQIILYNSGSAVYRGDLVLDGDGYSTRDGLVLAPGEYYQSRIYISGNFSSAMLQVDGNTITPPAPPDTPSEPEPDNNALIVDTGVIQTPEDIPEDATGGDSVGGILIPALGAGLGGAAGAVGGTIASAVMSGTLPDIDLSPADVKVSPDVQVDSDGRIRPADIDINASDIFLDSGNYMLADLKDYFPFSIPWDLMAFVAGFRADPETPVVDFVLDMPGDITDIDIRVDLSPWDSVAALCREGMYVLFCIRWLMFIYRKFT